MLFSDASSRLFLPLSPAHAAGLIIPALRVRVVRAAQASVVVPERIPTYTEKRRRGK